MPGEPDGLIEPERCSIAAVDRNQNTLVHEAGLPVLVRTQLSVSWPPPVQQQQPLALERAVGDLEVGGVVARPNVLEHADGADPIERLRERAVVRQAMISG